MKNQFFIILSVLLICTSCDNTRVGEPTNEGAALHHQIDVWCPFDHGDIHQKSGDSVFVFTEERGNAGVYTLIVNPNGKNYNATFYETDSLNALYNVIGDIPGPKVFFKGVAFKVNEERLNEIESRIDKLFGETGSENYVDMLDGGPSFLVTYKGVTIGVNTGPMMARWKEFSIFLYDSVILPYEELREKGRREAELNHP
jgi:hypothetical protein